MAISGHEDILRLQVPVDYPVAVKEVHPGEDLPHDVLDAVMRQSGGRHPLNVEVQVLKIDQ